MKITGKAPQHREVKCQGREKQQVKRMLLNF